VGHSFFLVDALPTETWPSRLARRVAYHVAPLLLEYAREGLRPHSFLRWKNLEIQLGEQRSLSRELAARLTEAVV
jgi:hypothetical protein